jgi:hypothetical protein
MLQTVAQRREVGYRLAPVTPQDLSSVFQAFLIVGERDKVLE